jgi:2-polyprenyl-3-methyl-5-hydroxy-6-metoxy-1,4-benzoquinol methylase
MNRHKTEVEAGDRFEFGKNWKSFLRHLDEARIRRAEQSLLEMLELPDLRGKTFLDIGSGSGLFSLAARRLGARVHSFDYDPESVACTRYLQQTYFSGDPDWTVEEGSILDESYIQSLGRFDIVYSWGVLHHTGAMWRAIENATHAVNDHGLLYIAIYNDEGPKSLIWHTLKKTYNKLPRPLAGAFGAVVMGLWELRALLVETIKLRPLRYFRSWTQHKESSMRGMSRWHDIVDWIGGYPFEVAKPDQVHDFLRRRDFALFKLATTRGLGCNEYVFSR